MSDDRDHADAPSVHDLPTTARAAVVETYGEPLRVIDLPVPELESGALLVRMDTATVCGSDVHFWRGGFGASFPLELPAVPGHEGVGRIVAFGDGEHVDSIGGKLEVGDRVIWAHAPCGHCHVCNVQLTPEMCPNLWVGYLRNCQVPPYIGGTFGEYAYVLPRAPRVRVPDSVPSGWASAASCALRSVVHAFGKLGPLDSTHTVVIQGSGAVGLFATAMAAVRHPRRLVVIGDPAPRLEIARDWGADATISVAEHPDPADRLVAVRDAVGADGVDVVMDMAGAPGAIAEGVEMLARNGRYLTIGTTGGEPQNVRVHLIVTRALRIIGSLSAHIGDYYTALQFMDQHRDRFDWDRLLGREYGLDEVTAALEAVRTGAEIKPLIVAGLDPTTRGKRGTS